jgi:hypothetical protein
MLSEDPRFLAGRVVDSEGNVIARPKAGYDAGTLSMENALKRPSDWEAKPNANEYPALQGLGWRNWAVAPARRPRVRWAMDRSPA